MSSGFYSDRILIVVKRMVRSRSIMTTIHFNWFEAAPEETYIIRTGNGVSIELDSHLPVRPQLIRFTDREKSHEKDIERYISRELADMLVSQPRKSFAVFLALTPGHRYALAGLQTEANESPLLMRNLCRAMADEHNRTRLM